VAGVGKSDGELVGGRNRDGRVDEVCAGDTAMGSAAAKQSPQRRLAASIELRMWRNRNHRKGVAAMRDRAGAPKHAVSSTNRNYILSSDFDSVRDSKSQMRWRSVGICVCEKRRPATGLLPQQASVNSL